LLNFISQQENVFKYLNLSNNMGLFLEEAAAQLALPILLLIVVLVWSLIWKGIASWRAARNGHIAWFVVFLLVHTLGILEILYLGVFSKMGESSSSVSRGRGVKKKRAKKRRRR
jgi:hypothetical protein